MTDGDDRTKTDNDQRQPKRGRKPAMLMLYDGDCGFCTYWARRWRQKVGKHLQIAPFQDESTRPPDLPVAQLQEAVHVVESDGSVYRGAAAVFRAMALKGHYQVLWWLYRRVPGFSTLTEWMYRWVANNRALVSRWTRWMRRDEVCEP